MKLQIYKIDLIHIFSVTNDEFENNVLIPLRNYDQNAEIRFDTFKYVFREDFPSAWYTEEANRLRALQILGTIAANTYFVEINFTFLNLPGSLFAEWIWMNQAITKVACDFAVNEGAQDLANAIKNDTIITEMDIIVPNHSIQTLSQAFIENKGIQMLRIRDNDDIDLLFLEPVIAFNKHIKHLSWGPEDHVKFDLEKINNALTTNSSLTSLEINCRVFPQEYSVECGLLMSQNIKNVQLYIQQWSFIRPYPDETFLIQSIRNMTHVKQLKLNLLNFKDFSPDLSNLLRESNASIQLQFEFFYMDETYRDLLCRVVQEISSWERQPEIHITMSFFHNADFDFNTLTTLLPKICLTKLIVENPSESIFLVIVDVLPNFKLMEDFHLLFDSQEMARQIVPHHYKLATAIGSNYSIKNVETKWANNIHGNAAAEKLIGEFLRRNKFHTKIRASIDKIPVELLPDFAEYTGDDTDFLFDIVKAHNAELFYSSSDM